MRMLTRKERQEIRGLVRQCANYDRAGKICLLMDTAGEPIDCPMLAIKQAGKVCSYFKESVLPLNPLLATVLTCGEPLAKRSCSICRQIFVPRNNRQLYCGEKCKKKGNAAKSRARMMSMRNKAG